jgi:hypothetical protein
VTERHAAALRRAAWTLPPVLLTLGALWFLASWALATDRGLDLTDEGLYLLEADPPHRSAAWLLPYGWHTAPLFRLVTYDVAAFRTLGAVILLGASGLLGWVAVRAGHRLREGGIGDGSAAPDPVVTALGVVAGSIGGFLYYAGMVRTPSYNWLTVLGAVLAATALLGLVGDLVGRRPTVPADRRGWRRWLPHGLQDAGWLALAGFGLFLTVPSKPTTPVLFSLLAVPALVARFGFASALRQLVTIAATSGLLLVLAVLAGLWAPDWLDLFRRAMDAPALSDTHGLVGAALEMVRLPQRAVEASPLLLGVLGLGALAWMGRRASSGLRTGVRVVAVPAGLLVATFAADLPRGVLFGGEGELRLVRPGMTTALLALLVTVALFGRRAERDPAPHEPAAETGLGPTTLPCVRGWTVLFLLGLPFVTAFGSDNLPFAQAALAASIFVGVALFVVGTTVDDRQRRAGGATLVVSLVVLAGVVGVDNHHHPYRIPPITQQTDPVAVGDRGAALRLDPERAELLRSLRTAAEAEGWTTGTRLFGLAPWSSTIPWHLGARVPDSIMPTLRGSESRLEYNLTWLDVDGWDSSWLLVTSADASRTPDLERSLANVETFTAAVGTTFPDDYVLVWRAPTGSPRFGDVELWRPAG